MNVVDLILKETGKLEGSERMLVTLPGDTDLTVSLVDREAMLLIQLLDQAGHDPGVQTVIAMRLIFWLQFLHGGVGVTTEPTDERTCPACGYPGLEADEEQNIDDFGPAWPEQPHERLTWFCPNCELAGTLENILADKNRVLPWKGEEVA